MTPLEQTTGASLAAAEAGDLDALKEALAARDKAIAALSDASPSPELAASLEAAIEAGSAAFHALQTLKLRSSFESGRLAQLQAGLVSGLDSPPDPQIDYRG